MNITVKHFLISGILALLIIQAGPASFAGERGISVRAKLERDSGKTIGDYRALIIGINDYKDDEIPDLKTAVNDARELAKVLKNDYGFTDIKLLLDSQATGSQIQRELRLLATSSSENDSILIYYAGHGDLDTVTKDGWWIPHDATARDPFTYIENSSIQKTVKAIPARHVLLIADSCFSGTLFGKARSVPKVIDNKYYAKLFEERSRWGMTSGNLTPVSDSGSGGHSVFAYQLLKTLKNNDKPYMTPREIYQNIAPIIGNNSDQLPMTQPIKHADDQGGEFIFIRKASLASTPPAQQETPSNKAATADDRAETAAWKLIENSTYPEDIQDFLNEFPYGIYAPVAKMKLKQLQRHGKQSGIEEKSRAEQARRDEERLRLQIELEQKRIELEEKRDQSGKEERVRAEQARREEERLRLEIELEEKRKTYTFGSSSSEGGFDPSSDNPYGEDF